VAQLRRAGHERGEGAVQVDGPTSSTGGAPVVGGGGSNDEESERENGASSGREGKRGARPCPFYREREGRGEVVGERERRPTVLQGH
jgi:hypothetical protein